MPWQPRELRLHFCPVFLPFQLLIVRSFVLTTVQVPARRDLGRVPPGKWDERAKLPVVLEDHVDSEAGRSKFARFKRTCKGFVRVLGRFHLAERRSTPRPPPRQSAVHPLLHHHCTISLSAPSHWKPSSSLLFFFLFSSTLAPLSTPLACVLPLGLLVAAVHSFTHIYCVHRQPSGSCRSLSPHSFQSLVQTPFCLFADHYFGYLVIS